MLERWTAVVVRRRIAVVAFWLAALGVGIWASMQLPGLLGTSFAVPGTESDRAQAILARSFGERPEGTFTVVFRVGGDSTPALPRRLQARLARAARTLPGARVQELQEGPGVLYGDVATTLDLEHAKGYTDGLRRALRRSGGQPALVTGQPAIQRDLDPIFRADLRRGEAIALPVALLVLIAVLGLSLAVAIPFVFAACTITTTLAIVYAVAHRLETVTFVTNLVELIGLGIAIDYSLLVVHRFREELRRGRSVDDAVALTMATAGRAAIFSAAAVSIGLGLLLLMPVPLIRSLGVGGFVIPLVSIAAVLTLQPALLSLFGPRGIRAVLFGGLLGSEAVEGGLWARLARVIMRRPVVVLLAGSALLAGAAAPVAGLKLTPGSISSIPSSPESVRGFRVLAARVGAGAATPIHVVVDAGSPGAVRERPVDAAIARLADRLLQDPEAYVVARGHRAPYVDASGRYGRVVVVGRHEYGDRRTRRLVDRLRLRAVPAARFPAGVRVYAGGAPPEGVDFLARAYDVFPWLVVGALALTFAVLLRAFRSLLLPLKAVLLNVVTVAAVYGLLAAIFGGPVEGWIPIVLFATLFGISMDYEVFLVTRMREAWDRVPDNARAVAYGLERTGRVVTAAAAIMVAAFSGFIAGRVPGLQQFGTGLVLAIVIDATIVRALLLPAAMAVLGRWNWWLPGRVARLARVAPSRGE